MPKRKALNQTYIAFDYGERRIGVAVGQGVTKTATPLKTLTSSNKQINWQEIKKLLLEWLPHEIIVGIPEDSDKNKALRKKIMHFCQELSQISNLPVTTHDETLTSDEAYQQLKIRRRQAKGKINKADIDQLSAALLLESWMSVNLDI